jgi:hypothetical protein
LKHIKPLSLPTITKNKINYLLISLLIPGYFTLINPGKIVLITVFAYVPVLIFIFKFILNVKIHKETLFKVILFYGLIMVVRGTYYAESKADYGSLVLEVVPVCLIVPFSYLLGKNIYVSSYIIKIFVKYTVLFSIFPILVFFLKNSNYDGQVLIRAISQIYFLILIFFKLKSKERVLLVILTVISLYLSVGNRSHIINIVISILILIFVSLTPRAIEFFGKKIWLILLLIPFIFIYSKFQKGEFNFSNDSVTDSRTSIYNDVYFALAENDDFLFGLGPVKIPTILSKSSFNDKSIYDEGRIASESLLLNYFHWGGGVMVLLFLIFVMKGVYLLLFKANNWLATMLAFFVLFRFLYGLVEFRLGYDLSSFFYFFTIGLAYNTELRSMNNKQIVQFLKY